MFGRPQKFLQISHLYAKKASQNLNFCDTLARQLKFQEYLIKTR